ncbi:MAG: glycyl radical protein [Phycisphaerae bacterium]|nr:glycyl radical protein [Phycisphaerae bacterium]
MGKTRRIENLRKISVETQPYISSERAELITDFYQTDIPSQVPIPICRAKSFEYLMANKTVCITEGELIVGERGPAPRATPTYPELCCHGLEDFRIMDSRPKTQYKVAAEVMKVYEEKIIPFWSGKTMREKVFGVMTPQWHKAHNAGVYTEFMEQRAPGHAIMDDKIYYRGMLDFKEAIAASRKTLDFDNDPKAKDKAIELEAIGICADALITFAGRHAEKARELAADESDAGRKAELEEIAAICDRVPAHAPRTFHEALQMYWFVHQGVTTELNTWDSFNPGRLDVNLYPFYKRDIENGTLDQERAIELLHCFWIKFNNQPAPPKVGITEEASGTYTDFALINVGGILPHNGSDAVNDLSYMILDVVEEMQMTQPSACIQLSKKNPDRFLNRACKVVRKGFGQPSLFNTDVIMQEMLHDGKSIKDGRAGGPSGCVTISAFGKESCTLTGYINWPKIFEITCHDGIDPESGERIGIQTGDPRTFETFEDLMDAYRRQLKYFVDMKIEGNSVIERLFAKDMPSPFMSILMDDCIARGLDYHNGGPRYNTTYIPGVGLGTLADAITAMKCHVFEKKTVSMAQMLEAMDANFKGHERLQQILLNRTPKYGNDDDYADTLAEDLFEAYFDVIDGRPNTKGGYYRVNLLPTTVHIYFGEVTGALPNGRRAGLPLSDGISPSQDADSQGPTSVVKSAARLDHARTGGTLLNLKFNPNMLAGDCIHNLAHLTRAYFKMDGHHVQFNVIDAKTLKIAQEKPELNRDLIVRVAGYSDHFVDLGRGLQVEIISRTEQQTF